MALLSVAEMLRRGLLIDLKDGNHGTNHPKSESSVSRDAVHYGTILSDKFEIDYDGAPRVQGKVLDRLRVGFSIPNDVILTHKAL